MQTVVVAFILQKVEKSTIRIILQKKSRHHFKYDDGFFVLVNFYLVKVNFPLTTSIFTFSPATKFPDNISLASGFSN